MPFRTSFDSLHLKVSKAGNSRNGIKNREKVFSFLDNIVWIGDDNFSQFQTGYLRLAVNVLTSTPKIWNLTKGDTFQIISPQSDEEIW